MAKEPALKRCPFCHSTRVGIQYLGAYYAGRCGNCLAQGPSLHSAEDAEEHWQNRIKRGPDIRAKALAAKRKDREDDSTP